MKVVDSTAISVWYSLSFAHLRLANEMTRLSRELEEKFTSEKSQSVQELVKPYAIGGIMAAATFLESNINELFEKIVDKPDDYNSISKDCKQDIINWWNSNRNNTSLSIVAKYQKILVLCKKNKFKKGNEKFKNVQLVIHLRNDLTHYKPGWNTTESEIDDIPVSPQKFQDELRDKIKVSKFFENTSNPFYPDKCLGYGVTKWALSTAYEFATEVYNLLDINPDYTHILKDLSELKSRYLCKKLFRL